MGIKPKLHDTMNEELVGIKDIKDALDRLFRAIEDGRIKGTDYFVKFVSAKINKHAGSCKNAKRRSPELTVEMLVEVVSAFKDVENGNLNEEGYYFELTTPYFQYKSGRYPQKQKDGNAYLDDSQESHCFSTLKLLRPRNGLCIRLSASCFSMKVLVVLSLVMVQTTSSVASEERALTLTAGENGSILFDWRNRLPSAPKYYTVKFDGKDRPFFIDGSLEPEGLMSPDQAERFRVEYVGKGSAVFIIISIAHVTVEDQGTYVVLLIIQGEIHEHHEMKRVVEIFIPPGPADCFLKRSETSVFLLVECHSEPGDGNSTLTCFQNGNKIPYLLDGKDTQIVYKRKFWLLHVESPVSCCSHDVKDIGTIVQTTCDQYTYPKKDSEIIVSPNPQSSMRSSKMALKTTPFSIEGKNEKPPSETRAYSGCARDVDWAFPLLPIMSLVMYLCIFNP